MTSPANKSEIFASLEAKLNQVRTTTGIEFTEEELTLLREMFNKNGGNRPEMRSPLQDEETRRIDELVAEHSRQKNYCYLSMVRLLPGFETSTFDEFQQTFYAFATGLGEEPAGHDALVNLCVMERVLKGGDEQEFVVKQDKH